MLMGLKLNIVSWPTILLLIFSGEILLKLVGEIGTGITGTGILTGTETETETETGTGT